MWVDLAGKRLPEVLALLRGKTDSVLRIAYVSAKESPRKEVALTRKQVLLLDDRARGAIFQVPQETGGMRKIASRLDALFQEKCV